MKRCILFVLIALLTQASVAWPCGMNTHAEVSVRARWFFNGETHPDWKQWLNSHQDALQAGSTFPDWGYAFGYHDESEDAHWDPFMQTAAQYIYETYPQPWDNEETQKLAVFILGIVAHHMADVNWHRRAGIAEGFIQAMGIQEFNGSFGDSHNVADAGGDMLIPYQQDMSWHSWSYYFPVDDMAEVYSRFYGDDHVTPEILIPRTMMLALGGVAGRLGASIIAPYYLNRSSFLTEQFQDYFLGGLDDMGVWTQWKWEQYLEYMESGAPALSAADRPYGEDLGDEAQLELMEMGMTLWRDGLLDVETTRTARGVIHKVRYLGESPKATQKDSASISPKSVNSSVRFFSQTPYANAGQSLAVGDFNGDGASDLVIGAPGYGGNGDPQRGRIYLVYGGREIAGHGQEALSEATADQTLMGLDVYGRFGYALAVVDLNADGHDDLAVSAPTVGGDAWQYRGKVYVYFGTGSGLSANPDIEIAATENITNLGHQLASGDLDGDGASDLVIGSPFAKSGGRQRGHVSILLSSTAYVAGSVLTMQDVDRVISGENDFDWFGHAINVATRSEGETLLLVGAPTYDRADAPSTGRLYGFRASDLIQDSVENSPLFTLTGEMAFAKFASEFFVADLDGDGADELVVSAPTTSDDDGKFKGLVRSYDMQSLAGHVFTQSLTPKWSLKGQESFARYGLRIASRDLNSDGIGDLLVTQPYLNTDAGFESGAAYLYLSDADSDVKIGPEFSGPIWDIQYHHDKSLFGGQIAFPDLNGDGRPDVAVSASRDYRNARIGGAVTVFITPVPEIEDVWPGALIRGGSSNLQVMGQDLGTENAGVQVSCGGVFLAGRILDGSNSRVMTLLLDLPKDSPLGSCDILIKTRFGSVAMTNAFQCVDGNWDDVASDDDSDTMISYGPAAVCDEDEDDEGGCGC
jgi:glycosylphosphatidylinositol phospholipase D